MSYQRGGSQLPLVPSSASLDLDATRLERRGLRKAKPEHSGGQLGVDFRRIDPLRNGEDAEVVPRSILCGHRSARAVTGALPRTAGRRPASRDAFPHRGPAVRGEVPRETGFDRWPRRAIGTWSTRSPGRGWSSPLRLASRRWAERTTPVSQSQATSTA